MAQTAIYKQEVFVGMETTVTYEEIKKQVVAMLKEYKKLPGLIDAAEMKASGQSFYRPAEIGGAHFEHLASVGRAYTSPSAAQLKNKKTAKQLKEAVYTRPHAEDMFASMQGDDEEDQESLEEIVGILIGTNPYGHAGVLDPTGTKVVTQERAMGLAAQEAERLRMKMAAIDRSMNHLKGYAPHLEKLLRMRYIEKEKIVAVCRALGIQPRTQDEWHREAIGEIACLLGISSGY